MTLVISVYSRDDGKGNTIGFAFEYDGSGPGATTGKLTVSTWSNWHGGNAGVPVSVADHSTEYKLKNVDIRAGVFGGQVTGLFGMPEFTSVSVTPAAPNATPGLTFKFVAPWPLGINHWYPLLPGDLIALVTGLHTAGWPAS